MYFISMKKYVNLNIKNYFHYVSGKSFINCSPESIACNLYLWERSQVCEVQRHSAELMMVSRYRQNETRYFQNEVH
jgi:hypothetical protein